jgi:hypothetical protein
LGHSGGTKVESEMALGVVAQHRRRSPIDSGSRSRRDLRIS